MALRDPRREAGQRLLDDLATLYLDHPDVDRGAMFGSQTLRVLGKVFGFVGRGGELVVKVPAERATALVKDGTATRIRIGRNPAREWISLPLATTDRWGDLLAESLHYVSQAAAPPTAESMTPPPRARREPNRPNEALTGPVELPFVGR